MNHHPPIGLACLVACGTLTAAPLALHQDPDGRWTLLREGKPFIIRGAGGSEHLDLLPECGGNTIRTWGIDNLTEKVDGKSLVERAREHQLLIAAGIWLGHERHGFRYDDPVRLERQRREVRSAVAKWKHEPAICLWSLGNEMEGSGHDKALWKELELLAGLVRSEDPDRPIMTVIAGAGRNKIAAIKRHCPTIDILGVNAYAAAPDAAHAIADAGWKKPFVLSEFGPRGHWEVGKTSWGAPLEPTCQSKAADYASAHQRALEDGAGRCLGSFAFFWGQKQERTPTWYSMFLPTGEKLPPVDAMAHAWTGRWPANRCPDIKSFGSQASGSTVKAGDTIEVSLQAGDPDGHPLKLNWSIATEATDLKHGGDAESKPPESPVRPERAGDGKWHLPAPARPGFYRLFLVVRDGHGAASAANFPFQVR